MEGQSALSRGALLSPYSAYAAPVLPQTSHSPPSLDQSFRVSAQTDGRVKVFWKLPPPRLIPVHPEVIRSQTFCSGDTQKWRLKCCRLQSRTHVSVYLQKEFEGERVHMKEFKANVAVQLFQNGEKLDQTTRLFTFSSVQICTGFSKAFPITEEDDTDVLEVTVAPGWNNEQSRRETQFVGLLNEGNSCYINALLQTLYHISSFRQAVFQIPSAPYSDNVAFCLQKVFYDLMKSQGSVGTKCLMESLSVSEDHAQEDVHEFSLKFFEKLIEAAKDSPLAEFVPSLIEGETETQICCTNVDFASEPRPEKFLDLQLSVADSEMIEDSVRNLCKEYMTEENQFEANHFGKQDAFKIVRFKRLPPVLQIYLKRFEYRQGHIEKINDHFAFPEVIDLSEHLTAPSEAKYQLFSILVHKGQTYAGHYFAFVKTNLSEWFKFNDHSVDKVSYEQVKLSSFGGEVLDFAVRANNIEEVRQDNDMSAYMLCYIRTTETRRVFNPKLDLPHDLEEKLKRGLFERQPIVAIPASVPTVSEFEVPYVTFCHLRGWKGPGIFSVNERKLVPNDLAYETMKLPTNYTAGLLLEKLKQDCPRKNYKLWLFYPRESDWQLRPLQLDAQLYQSVNAEKMTQMLYIETEENQALSEAKPAENCEVDTVPEEPVSSPLKWEEKVFVFLKVYRFEWDCSDLMLQSAASINEEEVSVQEVKRFMLKECDCASGGNLYLERSRLDGGKICHLIDTRTLASKKTTGSTLLTNGDALILELAREDERGVTPDEFVNKLLLNTTLRFAPVPQTDTKDQLLALGANDEFQEEVSSRCRLDGVIDMVHRRFAGTLPGLKKAEVGIYLFDRAAKGQVRLPHPVNLSDPQKNPLLESLLQNKKVLFGIDRPKTSTEPDVEISVWYIDSKHALNPKPILRTLPATCTVQDVSAAIQSELRAIWQSERGEDLVSVVNLYELEGSRWAYVRKLTRHVPVKSLLASGSHLAAKVELESEKGTRFDCVVYSEGARQFRPPKYVVVQLTSTCAQALEMVKALFLPCEVKRVQFESRKTKEVLRDLEPSSSIFASAFSAADSQLLVTIE